jgi:hypothetical protein
MKQIISVFLMVVLSSTAFADQTFRVANNETVIAAFSKNEITRVSFQDDIVSVNSLKGEFEYEVQGRELFLRVSVDKPINFFVKIQNGNIYKIIATPEDIAATQIFVKPKIMNKHKCKI